MASSASLKYDIKGFPKASEIFHSSSAPILGAVTGAFDSVNSSAEWILNTQSGSCHTWTFSGREGGRDRQELKF